MSTVIRAVGIKGTVDSLSQIRVVQPLRALASEYAYSPKVTIGGFNVNWGTDKGIFISYRLHPQTRKDWDDINQKCDEGWLWVHDVDDDPRYLKGQVSNKFRSIATAHIVTCTTPELAEVCKEWNDHVYVVPNQIPLCPPESMITKPIDTPRILFGALNRSNDWEGGLPFIVDTLSEFSDQIEVFNIADETFAEAFPKDFPLRNLKHQSYLEYQRLLDHLDISLIPLSNSEFNQSKSDLKIIEALAHGLVPITSRLAAERSSVPNDLLLIVDKPEDWARHLVMLLDDPKAIPARKLRGYNYVSLNRMWKDHAGAIDKIYQQSLQNFRRLQSDRNERIHLRRADGLPA